MVPLEHSERPRAWRKRLHPSFGLASTLSAARVATAVVLTLAPGNALTQTLGAEQIQRAIEFGYSNAHGRAGFSVYDLGGGASLSTPFSRIALAAAEVKGKYGNFTRAHVTSGMLQPVLLVSCCFSTVAPFPIDHIVVAHGASIIQPTTITPAHRRSLAVVASFPMSVLKEGNEIRLIAFDGTESKTVLTPELLSALPDWAPAQRMALESRAAEAARVAAQAAAAERDRAFQSLMNRAPSQPEDPRLERIRQLVSMKAKEAIPDLIRLLSDPSTEVRESAVRALGDLGSGSSEALEALETLAKQDIPPSMRSEIKSALEILKRH